jgi:acyl-CoA synthetase (AMP-forming)/AMP-acid ligase II
MLGKDYQEFLLKKETSLIATFQNQVEAFPNKVAFTHLTGNCAVKEEVTFQELECRSLKVAVALSEHCQAQECVIILIDDPIHFIEAFWGCICAGVIAVPVPVARYEKSWLRLSNIVADSRATTILTDDKTLSSIKISSQARDIFNSCHWVIIEETRNKSYEQWNEPCCKPDDTVFLQYTSGSTGQPKGVMVSQTNIFANVQDIAQYFSITEKTISVSWLPLFHDMGLVAHVIIPSLIGHHSVIMKPVEFIKRPIRWLNAISKYKATLSGAPNFAYELCVNRVTENDRKLLDLSSWGAAYIGSEPIRSKTLERFYASFKDCGLERSALTPVYGMAEATLMITGMDRSKEFSSRLISADDNIGTGNFVVHNEAINLGFPIGKQLLIVVNPDTLTINADNEIGEIWVKGENIGKGYWRNSELSEQCFHAQLSCIDNNNYLRTGDLGFFYKGELFITGRLKDLILIKGENYSAVDFEATVEAGHPMIRSGCCAAFSILVNGEEKPIIACELLKKVSADDKLKIVSVLCDKFMFEYGLALFDIVLLAANKLPRTTSGKLQRQICKEQYVNNAFVKEDIQYPGLGKQRAKLSG